MKNQEFVDMIMEIIDKKIQKAVKKEVGLLFEQKYRKSAPIKKREYNEIKKILKRPPTEGKASIKDLLRETEEQMRNGGNNKEVEDRVLQFDTSDLAGKFGYGDMTPTPSVIKTHNTTVRVEDIPKPVIDAITKDYGPLMKRMKEMKEMKEGK